MNEYENLISWKSKNVLNGENVQSLEVVVVVSEHARRSRWFSGMKTQTGGLMW